MITIEDINAAIADVKPLFLELQNLYERLPETRCRCEQPGLCCAFLPQITWMEALQWIAVIREASVDVRSRTLLRFLEFYLTSPIRRTGCPFLEKGACGIYERRPFACRAYGLWSADFGKARTRKSRQDRKSLLQLWQKFGLTLPAKMVQFEMDYCDRVDCATDNGISDDQLMAVLQEIYKLDKLQGELQLKFENEYHSDFSLLLAALLLGYRKAVLGKFAVVKEMVQKQTDARLQQMLLKANPHLLRKREDRLR